MQLLERALEVHNLSRGHGFLLLPIYLSLYFLNVFVFFSVLAYDLPGLFVQITIEETSRLLLLSDISDFLT